MKIRKSLIFVIITTIFGIISSERYTYAYDIFNPYDTRQFQTIEIFPWKTFEIDPEYGGSYFLMADVNNDNNVEIVSCRHYDFNDVHSVSSVACQNLNGKLLWHFGVPNSGTTFICSEQPMVLYDWDNDGQIEVLIISGNRFLVLNGQNGLVKRNCHFLTVRQQIV